MFIHDDFMLQSAAARRLYHEHAAGMPIFDYHCHLSAAAIADDARYENLTQIWLAGDHYKWRAMRANGIDERLITGDGSDREKFGAWARTVPATLGNPLYHWTHLELRRFFGMAEILLNETTADEIWERTGVMLTTPGYSVRGILERMNVRVICTSDDPVDDLEAHQAIARDEGLGVKVLPTFRPDKAVHLERGDEYRAWIVKLEALVGHPLGGVDDLLAALESRIDYFHGQGCRLSDHALMVPVCREATSQELDRVYQRVREGGEGDAESIAAYQTFVLSALGEMYRRREWTMQLHLGALRDNHRKRFEVMGPDAGCDSIGDGAIAVPLNQLLNRMASAEGLPRMILYTLNASWNDVLATTIGNFQEGPLPGKLQFGPGWWFHDQADGMRRQMTSLATMGLLSRFVGMVTDSRSFLSYSRHEYFRRVLCDMLGGWVERGEVPADDDLLGRMVRDICWHNAVNYFGVEV